ncbi:microtubule-associated proteins 1A/1B light chain 3C-like isoform X2 [Euwallacea fornicatus]|uniref:microtubule-associated proteins 1A/1B light chain 3C-like isoform X2 n=1 Tax=Euwallacea fornicatus TaxID=995702 RepID=UPI00338EC03C
MKEGKKMMVMEVKIAALSKMGAKEIKKEEVMAIRTRFPNKIPVIVQKYWKDNELPQLDKSKFLVPQDITMSQFQTIIRNRMHMGQSQALYLLVNERSMLSLSLTLGEVYTEHAGPNGFLYITYASQEVFGGENANRATLLGKNSGDVDTCSSTRYSTKYFAREYEDIINS